MELLNVKLEDGTWASIPTLQGPDGYTPIRGVDYWTEEDKQEIKDNILTDVTNLTNSVNGLKEDLAYFSNTNILAFIKGFTIPTDGETANINNPAVSAAGYSYLVDECTYGDVYAITGKGGNSPRLWAFVDANGTIISRAGEQAAGTNLRLSAPKAATHFVCNVNADGGRVVKGETVKDLSDQIYYISDKLYERQPEAEQSWEFKTINATTGVISIPSKKNRILSSVFLARKGTKIYIKPGKTNGLFGVYAFSDLNRTAYLGRLKGFADGDVYTLEGDAYIAVLFAIDDDSIISSTEVAKKRVAIEYTDRLNKIENAIADSGIYKDMYFFAGNGHLNNNTGALEQSTSGANKYLMIEAGDAKSIRTNVTFNLEHRQSKTFLFYVGDKFYSKREYNLMGDMYYYIDIPDGVTRIGTNITDKGNTIDSNIVVEQFVDSAIYKKQNSTEKYLRNLLENDFVLMHRQYNGKKEYRVHIDECILCLWRLATNNYDSVFDEPFFAEYKRIHDLYGTVFVLSLHYTQLNGIAWKAPFPQEMIGWTLADMPDKWRAEFDANSDWLKFSYHTYAYEYKYRDNPESRDWEQDIIDMQREVERFAGYYAWSKLFVKTHGIHGDRKLIKMFQRQGAKYFEGDAEHVEKLDNDMQSYYLTNAQQEEMFKNGTWYDDSVGATFFAGAGNIERLYGFINGGDGSLSIDMDDYMDRFVNDGSYIAHQRCNYLSFCGHESPMINGLVVIGNGVSNGDYIQLNGRTYTAGADFAIGADDNATMANLYAALQPDTTKYRIKNNLMTIYAEYGTHSDAFTVKTSFQQIEKLAKWCSENGWVGKHLDESSFYDF